MAEKGNGKYPRHFPLSAMVMVLFVALTLTSGMVGFLLGRNASGSSGELVDTIVLSPGEESLRGQETVRYLSGRLCHSSGDPVSGATVLLVDTENSDVTDSQGKFYFSGVQAGDHRLEVKSSSGDTVTEMELTLDFSGSVSADFSGGSTSFQMPEDARMLEFTLTMGEDSVLEVEAESAYFVTRDGKIVDFAGSALKVSPPARAVLPEGSLVSAQGDVLLPAKGVVVPAEGSPVPVSPGEEAISGVVVEKDGSVKIEDGSTLSPDGELTLPDGETVTVGDNVILVEDGEAEEVPQLPEEYAPPAKVPVSPPAQSSSGQSPADAPDREPESSLPPESSETETWQGLDAIDAETGISWKQRSAIDLFKHRTEAFSDRAPAGGTQVVAPGSKGYYEFRLENPENFDIAYTLCMEEHSFHLPIRYSMINEDTNYSYLYREKISSSDQALQSKQIVIPANSVQHFRIDWEWEYEDWYAQERDNALDLAAGKAGSTKNRTYLVSITLNASQIIKEPEISYDGDFRYPGVH